MTFSQSHPLFLRHFIRKWFPPKMEFLPPVQYKEGRPQVLMVTFETNPRNQNFYRDAEIARRFSTLWLTERFPWAEFDYDLAKILARLSPDAAPAWVYVNYHRHFTAKIRGWEALEAPVAGWVGDPQNFIMEGQVFQERIDFFRRLRPRLLLTPQPGANHMVRQGLEDDTTPILECFWGIPPEIFRPLGLKRRYDIACLGSHTPRTYPFRNQVREYLLHQPRLKFFKKRRIKYVEDFPWALNRLKSCFTDASIYDYTLAKYFEIPACGALLFGQPTADLPALGFEDGVNFVAVTPEDFREKMEHYLLAAPEDAARITLAGTQLVHQRHTWPRRITGLLKDIAGHLQQTWPDEVFLIE